MVMVALHDGWWLLFMVLFFNAYGCWCGAAVNAGVVLLSMLVWCCCSMLGWCCLVEDARSGGSCASTGCSCGWNALRGPPFFTVGLSDLDGGGASTIKNQLDGKMRDWDPWKRFGQG
ncbi:unnamed protein product [Meloidogyne enterolobii]|uniref:Uncharacterized protein n=1 Tax=Meloidogyne enterolobii TaxID=390850 RepID=A0ACB1AGP3_MELEN